LNFDGKLAVGYILSLVTKVAPANVTVIVVEPDAAR
jgi:hypothetical protein